MNRILMPKKIYNGSMLPGMVETTYAVTKSFMQHPSDTYGIFNDSIGAVLFAIDYLKANKRAYKDFERYFKEIDYPKIPKRFKTLRPRKKIPKNNPYLKSSKLIERDADIIARLSDRMYDKSSDDIFTYAEKSFRYVADKIEYLAAPHQTAYGTLYHKKGVCYGKLNLYAALCRRQGIPVRFKIIPYKLTQGFEDVFINFAPEPLLKKHRDLIDYMINIKIPHHFMEIRLPKVNGWINVNPIQPSKIYEAIGIGVPSIESLILEEKNKSSTKKKKHVTPAYATEIYSLFVKTSEIFGRCRLGVEVNEKISEMYDSL